MTTLALLKSEISDDLASGSAFDSVIATEITKAIDYYSSYRFYFTESRERIFSTVADQAWYEESDDADIPLFLKFDTIIVEESGHHDYPLTRMKIQDFELLTDGNSTSSKPTSFTSYDKKIGLFPIPDKVYTIRMIGHYKYPAPSSDVETNNHWMVEAYNLIRSRVLYNIYLFKIKDEKNAAAMLTAERLELDRLEKETSMRAASNKITAQNI